MRAFRLALGLLVGLWLLWPSVAAAADNADDLNAKGVAAFKAGRFLEAAQWFDAAFAVDSDPILLFNAARAFERGGNRRQALARYQAVARDPNSRPSHREVAQQHVAAFLEAAPGGFVRPRLDSGDRRERAGPEVAIPAAQNAADVAKQTDPAWSTAAWTVLGVGAVSLVTSATLWAVGGSERQSLEDRLGPPGNHAQLSQAQAASENARLERLEAAAIGTLGAGIALGLTGAALWALAPEVDVVPVVGLGSAGVSASF